MSAAYATGFFANMASFAFASDHLVDLIPCDTVAALVIAAAARAYSAATAAAAAKVYHAASAESYPLQATHVVNDILAPFWSAHPPPLRLPLTG